MYTAHFFRGIPLNVYVQDRQPLLFPAPSGPDISIVGGSKFIFFNSDFPVYNRVIAADTLVILHDLEIHDAAYKVLQIEENIEIRAACLRLLYNTHNKEYINYVRALTADDHFVIKLYSFPLYSRFLKIFF